MKSRLTTMVSLRSFEKHRNWETRGRKPGDRRTETRDGNPGETQGQTGRTRVFPLKVKETSVTCRLSPGLIRLRRPPLGFRNGPALLNVQISRMTIIKTPTSYFAFAIS
jgi:hypothetical protein